MSCDTKYKDLINTINLLDPCPMDFDENIAKEIVNIKNTDISPCYTDYNWEKLIKLAIEKNSIELMVALIKCPYMPNHYFFNLRHHMDKDIETLLLIGNAPDDIIFELTDDKGFAEKAMIECDKYHPKVIDFLSKDISLKTLTDMHFIPFSLTYNTYIINEIPKMLENDKNCFDEDVPELFTTAIINNPYITDKLKDKAFDIGYVADDIENYTPYIAEKLYEYYANSIFELDAQSMTNVFYMKKASQNIINMIQKGVLSSEHQIDFINRCKYNNSATGTKTVVEILSKTKDHKVIEYGLSHLHMNNLKTLHESNEHINDKSFKELLKVNEPEKLKSSFILSILNHNISTETIKKFLNLKSKNINMAIIVSDYTSEYEKKEALKIPYPSAQEELTFLYQLRNKLPYLSRTKSDIILFYAIKHMVISQSKNFDGGKTYIDKKALLDKAINMNVDKWFVMDDYDYISLKRTVKETEQLLPSVKKTTEELLDKIDQVYNESILIKKYPHIFKVLDRKYGLYATVYDEFNMEELYKLPNTERKILLEDLKKYGNGEVFSSIIDGFEHMNTNYENRDEIFKYVYVLADFYNELSEFVREKNKEIEPIFYGVENGGDR